MQIGMSSILNLEPISATQFNNIPVLNSKIPAPSENQLHLFAELFVNHNHHRHYGIGIRHRHVNLVDEEIVVHRMQDADLDVWTVETKCNTRNVVPNAYLYCDDQFRPYEHDTCTERPLPLPEFLCAFRDLLLATNTVDRLAIVSIPALSLRDSVEVVLPDNAGMHTKPRSGNESSDSYHTSWTFFGEKGENASYAVYKRCVKNETTGEHVIQR